MPWSESTPMDQKSQFILDHHRLGISMTELVELYHVSRKTGYKWIGRYKLYGPPGLEDRSRRPRAAPNATPKAIAELILDARRRHPSWGARKLMAILHRAQPRLELPSRSTVCEILSRSGMVLKKRVRRVVGHPGRPVTPVHAPNDAWSADYKGQFRTRDGPYCYPLTVTDNFSRYLLGCQALRSTATSTAKPVFTRLFEEFGLPTRIRTDNGSPFATCALGRLSRLSAWWVRLGITPEFIEPGCPQQNGRHERMHRTLKDEATRPAAGNLAGQQRKFNEFREEFNEVRPHEALDMRTPAECYSPSSRPMPTKLKPFEYPDRFEVRYVSDNGGIRWSNDWVNVSTACIGENVGLEEVDDGFWDVYFGTYKVGRLNERKMRIESQYAKLKRRKV